MGHAQPFDSPKYIRFLKLVEFPQNIDVPTRSPHGRLRTRSKALTSTRQGAAEALKLKPPAINNYIEKLEGIVQQKHSGGSGRGDHTEYEINWEEWLDTTIFKMYQTIPMRAPPEIPAKELYRSFAARYKEPATWQFLLVLFRTFMQELLKNEEKRNPLTGQAEEELTVNKCMHYFIVTMAAIGRQERTPYAVSGKIPKEAEDGLYQFKVGCEVYLEHQMIPFQAWNARSKVILRQGRDIGGSQ